MKIVVVSDSHGAPIPDVPPCDLLLMAGDVMPYLGSTHRLGQIESALEPFAEWLERQPATHIVGVAGNMDFAVVDAEDLVRSLPWTYLQDESAVVGGVGVWGSPWTAPHSGTFQASEWALERKWATIPDDTQIVVTHSPAYGILDTISDGKSVGSPSLRERLRSLHDLQMVATGHVHESYGMTTLLHVSGREIPFVNGSTLQRDGNLNPPIEIEVELGQ